MRERCRAAAVLAAVATLLAACGSAPDADSSADTADPHTRYTDAQLTSALPTGEQLRGRAESATTCDSMSEPCDDHVQGTGFALVTGSLRGPQSIDLSVSVTRDATDDAWETRLENCPQGEIDRPLVIHDEDSYRPGTRGTSDRTPWSVGEWTGFICTTQAVDLWPDDQVSDPYTRHEAYLRNDHHLLYTLGADLAETQLLAEEYLERLEAAAETS